MAKTGVVAKAFTAKPPKSPNPTAETVLAMAKSNPKVPDVIKNIAGSIKGEANQKAITAERGAPATKSAAINGITSQEQKGETPPSTAARKIIRVSRP